MPTVPLESSQQYKDAFAMVARQKGTTMAALVKEALDARYGAEIQAALPFFAPSGDGNHQSEDKVNNG